MGLRNVWQNVTLGEEVIRLMGPGLPGPKKLKRQNLAISSFKKGQMLKNEKGQIKAKFSIKICLNNSIQC